MFFYHDSRNAAYRNPIGALTTSARLIISALSDAESVILRLWWDGKETCLPMEKDERGLFSRVIETPRTPGLLWYYFIAQRGDECAFYGNAEDTLGGEGQLYGREPPSYQITVYDAAYETPSWMRDGIMYQIMVDRFCAVDPVPPPQGRLHASWDEVPDLKRAPQGTDTDADDFFGGNLRGVMSRLDYLKDLGVSILYLNPIFEARSNHKYDTGDYERVDPSFGTNDDLSALCEAARARGMRVILDGVFSHTGSDSRYFNRSGRYESLGAYQSPDSPYASWYTFRRWPDDYACWWGFVTLPEVNELDEGYQKYIVTGDNAIVKRWLRRGTSGWRLDVADELPMPFLKNIRRHVKATSPDAAVIGEVWEDASNKVAYGEGRSYCLGDTLDSVMNYPLRDGLIAFMNGELSAPMLKRRLDALYENYPKPFSYSLMNLVGSHDRARIINRLSGAQAEDTPRDERAFVPLSAEAYARGRERFIRVWRFVCALPGMPCLYYGDEAGAQGGDDPFCRCPYPWGREDRALTAQIAQINHARLKSAAARRGSLELIAKDDDTITAVRACEGERMTATLSRV